DQAVLPQVEALAEQPVPLTFAGERHSLAIVPERTLPELGVALAAAPAKVGDDDAANVVVEDQAALGRTHDRQPTQPTERDADILLAGQDCQELLVKLADHGAGFE